MRLTYVNIAVVVVMLFITGCGLLQPVGDTTVEEKTSERIIYRDTSVVVGGDFSQVETLLQDLLKGQQIESKSGNSTVTVRYLPETRTIQADCECDTALIELQLRDKILESYIKETTVKKRGFLWGMSFTEMLLLGLLLFLAIKMLFR
jgi:hypothetical protein